jgi:F0F1-type ATP synthase delta subunit
MDGLSVAASIIAILQLTGTVIGYLNDIKNASKECQQCATEASNLHSLLINLLYHLDQGQTGDGWYTAVRTLNVENGPLDQYKQALEQLRSRVESQDGIQNVKMRLLWKFSKEEIASILSRMERLKSLVNIALEMDHL